MIINADVTEGLKQIPDASIQCVVTSPPYWGLRDYGIDSQLGLEKTPEEYTARMVEIFREVKRVLRNDGTVWLNLGDSYATSSVHGSGFGEISSTAGVGNSQKGVQARAGCPNGLKPKDLCGIPWRVAFALQTDGWYLRSDIIWAKPNPMPESVTDRPTKSHEYIFLLTKSAKYFYDAEAIAEKAISSGKIVTLGEKSLSKGQAKGADINPSGNALRNSVEVKELRNKRSVWTIATEPFAEAHFATFPTKLVEPCVLAGSKHNDTVLDPFCGSGTVGVVSIGLGRKFIGIELNPKYAEMAERRIYNAFPLLA